jgi:hypothetical protein
MPCTTTPFWDGFLFGRLACYLFSLGRDFMTFSLCIALLGMYRSNEESGLYNYLLEHEIALSTKSYASVLRLNWCFALINRVLFPFLERVCLLRSISGIFDCKEYICCGVSLRRRESKISFGCAEYKFNMCLFLISLDIFTRLNVCLGSTSGSS